MHTQEKQVQAHTFGAHALALEVCSACGAVHVYSADVIRVKTEGMQGMPLCVVLLCVVSLQ
jgi:hypothetical protein